VSRAAFRKNNPGRNFQLDDLRKTDPKFQPPRFDQYLEAANLIAQLARRRYDKDLLPAAVRWILDQGIEIAVWGARSPEQMEPVRDVFGWSIDADFKKEINRIIAQTIPDPVGPEFIAPAINKDSVQHRIGTVPVRLEKKL
jgi:aryl-alcohol dehydrogenase-like predicted oxidoreductase